MCGRIACALDPDRTSEATCCFDPSTGLYKKTPFLNDKTYNQGFNIPPTHKSPAIVSSEQPFINDAKTERVLIPMKFGIYGFGEEYNRSMMNHLSRAETLAESKLFRPMLVRGGRCAVPVTGFYEWQPAVQGKRNMPYFFYHHSNTSKDVLRVDGNWDETNGWEGVKLLYLAAVFTSYKDKEGKTNYSYVLISRPASEETKWVHHRLPVILETEEDIKTWINVKSTSLNDALKLLETPAGKLSIHLVDRLEVNASGNTSESCAREYCETMKQLTIQSAFKAQAMQKPGTGLTPKKIEPSVNQNSKKRKSSDRGGPLDKYFKKS